MGKKKKQDNSNTIAQNKKARHDFFIEEKFEAGLSLAGWEVKSIRAGKGQITDTYVHLKNGEAWLINAQIPPLPQACTHFVTEPTRPRKLLLKRRELAKLFQATEAKGYTAIALSLYWKRHLVKCSIALAKGKQNYDKRQTEKERDWGVQKQRAMRTHNREG